MPRRWRGSSVRWDRKCFRRCKAGSSESHREKKVVEGRKMRVDTTVTETNIHYPTDSSLLGDGVRVLTRTMKRIVEIGGKAGERVRDRMRSVGHRVMEIARITRTKGQKQTKEKLQASYKRLLNATGQVVAQAKRIAEEVKKGVKKSRTLVDQLRLDALQAELETNDSAGPASDASDQSTSIPQRSARRRQARQFV